MAGLDKKLLAIIVAAVVAAGSVAAFFASGQKSLPATAGDSTETKSLVPLDRIVSGGPGRDGIPSIDEPKFVSAQEADLRNGDLVLGLEINGDVRAYPLDILVWHEIVNDAVGGEPVAVTYCPLCFTNQVFKRTVEGEVVEFGTSGKLYNSNLVMYDRSTESYWSQALGQAIAGKRTGHLLERVPFDVAYWGDWKVINPDTKVLSQDTGFGRPYGADPYGDYYTSPSIYFPVSNVDDRLGPKEIVVGLDNGGLYRAYPLSKIEAERAINDDLAGRHILLASHYPFTARAFDRTVDGQVLEFEYKDGAMTDRQTASVWNFDGAAISGELEGKRLERLPFDQGFWFEWAAFHPETELY
ncbi:MAG: DUF3179 domain-containing protein [Nitrososphaera sp.]